MAKFRDSKVLDLNPQASRGSPASEPSGAPAQDRSIGDIIGELRDLDAQQIERILAYQNEKGVRFGEAAIALGLASSNDVMFALSQQFHYPYAPEGRQDTSAELVALNQPFSKQAEAFRAIRSQVIMRVFQSGETARALAVISPNSGDGKTFFAANLAVSLAQLGGRTLLVDADMRGPRLHEVFGFEGGSGLSHILSGRAEAQAIRQVAAVPSLFVLPVGITPPNPLELVERPALGLLMRELTSKFDHVVVDTPAAIYGSDFSVIAARCGAALLIARKNAAKVADLQELTAMLQDSPARLAGVIMNEF
jgi:protein-tyrosine kinase